MNKQTKILLLYAHPSQHRSEVNQPLFNAASDLDYVHAVDLYEEYPTFQIDINREQQRLINHDIIIFQFPLYWYSTPSILKEWQDLVLEHNFAYGREGIALQGKTFLCAITAGGNGTAYQSNGYNHFTIRELLRPLEQTADLTGMTYIAPFAIFGSRTATEENRIEEHVGNWKHLLSLLNEGALDIPKASQADFISNNISELTITQRKKSDQPK